MDAMSREELPEALQRGHALGSAAMGLKQILMENLVAELHHLTEANGLNQCMKKPELMLELLTMISSCTVLKPGWRPSHHFGQVPSPGQWKLSCSSRDPDVENSAAGLVDADMTTVVATDYDGSRSREHFIQASFDRPVLIVAMHLGIGDLHGQGWSQEY